ncbi:MAG: signal recognition particle-docking protein FtsY [Gammaproteobacteria bacterium]|jgi:fused signal recognition particle receptor|nr:signal recognition particle-docking protein FtsY [Gammaproteobacteria bacterium]MBT5724003.1 signal recognition particle-docking protein FtsY [Gammaproteobacteria bacterium]MBT6583508.1 signal recognition particle-docking protein FtsY [Gammaproteobacteria bacterium]MBT6889905.1 signal recognition particle-docking protein FtsY [Gammaproteobacteria bacterium]MBT7879631.1 signal recognition particle-docking protein FtsY [Gammaproteobacteria bacterium]
MQSMPTNVADETSEDKVGFFERLKSGLGKTRNKLSEGLQSVFLGEKTLDEEMLEELETILLTSDVGVSATQEIIGDLTKKVSRKELTDTTAVYHHLQESLMDLLRPVELVLKTDSNHPFVILMVGVNGVGKTTTIGKLAKLFQAEGKSVMLAAGDTFRAAAVDQLRIWGERNEVPVIAQDTGADSASVVFDAVAAARARDIDVLIADTAGRLQNKKNLMDELAKITRVLQKIDPTAPHEVILVLDAGTGQNALSQAREFQKAVDVSGLVLTKLDGTAKGGVIFALAQQLNIPIRYVGVGEKIDDLRPFSAKEFVTALFE